jgi:hypothetical protein
MLDVMVLSVVMVSVVLRFIMHAEGHCVKGFYNDFCSIEGHCADYLYAGCSSTENQCTKVSLC